MKIGNLEIKKVHPIFEGKFTSLSDFEKQYPQSSYLSPSYLQKEKDDYLAGRFIFKDRILALTALVAMHPKQSLTILDIGGGFGKDHDALKEECFGKEIKYLIHDLPEVAEEGKAMLVQGRRYVQDISEPADIVLFSSSYHYIFEDMKIPHAEYILFLHTPFTSKETYYTAQKNIQGRTLPAKVSNLNDFMAYMEQSGYSCILKADSEATVQVNNIDEYSFLHLIFKKVGLQNKEK